MTEQTAGLTIERKRSPIQFLFHDNTNIPTQDGELSVFPIGPTLEQEFNERSGPHSPTSIDVYLGARPLTEVVQSVYSGKTDDNLYTFLAGLEAPVFDNPLNFGVVIPPSSDPESNPAAFINTPPIYGRLSKELPDRDARLSALPDKLRGVWLHESQHLVQILGIPDLI